MHPAIRKDSVAVVTGAAVGIGFAISQRLVQEGMEVILFDKDEGPLAAATGNLRRQHVKARVHAFVGDVASDDALRRLETLCEQLCPVSMLVNNAGIIPRAGPWEGEETWRRVMNVNFWSALKLQSVFVERMLSQSKPSAIVNLGSKEGITTPPGNAAYAVSKAALRFLTEQLAHELRQRGSHVSAHLLIPGYTFTPMNFPGMSASTTKPEAPWSAAQVANRMVEGMSAGDFYLFCEDNEVSHEVDQRRIQWSADDLILNRPALSRWHPDYREAFAAYVAQARRDEA